MKTRIFLFVTALSLVLFSVSAVMPVKAAPINNTDLPVTGTPLTPTLIEKIINNAASWLVGIALVFALIMIVYGAIMWMWSRGDDAKAGDARKIIYNGILGAAVILALGLIFSTIKSIVTNPGGFIP